MLDLNELLEGNASILARLIGSDLDLELALDPRAGSAKVDPTQFQQVVINLAINARDAMPTGGKLTIATEAVELSEPPRGPNEVEPGPYARIDVTDTGSGMDAEVLGKIFEPFYTTKELGKGTGLGLSTSHGIISQLGGQLSATSTPGQGTTFSILLPRVSVPSTTTAPVETEPSNCGGGETILLADDQEALRRVTTRVLRDAGYEVLEAGNGLEAVATADAYAGEIDLLLTDLVMPEMNGYELAGVLRAQRPQMRVLLRFRSPSGNARALWGGRRPREAPAEAVHTRCPSASGPFGARLSSRSAAKPTIQSWNCDGFSD